jgi:hypothetical protein
MTSIAERARAAAGKEGVGAVTFIDVQRQLVRGGYFRANLRAALTEFDIIAGGLAWGIRNSRVTIDVEFVENAAIRDKIKVSENICHALKYDMQCPHQLLPHQIQGLDYPCLAIVFKWLLQRVAATREDNAAAVKRFTAWDFRRRIGCPMRAGATSHQDQLHQYWLRAQRRGTAAPARQMIHAESQFPTPLEHASAVLLEYGDRYALSQVPQLAALEPDMELDAAEKRELQQQREEEERERAMLDNLLANMTRHSERAKVSSAGLDSLLSAVNTKRLAKLQRQFDERMEAMRAALAAEEEERSKAERRREELERRQADVVQLEGKAARSMQRQEAAEAAVRDAQAALDGGAGELDELAAANKAAERAFRKDAASVALLADIRAAFKSSLEEASTLEADVARGRTALADLKQEVSALAERLEGLQGPDEDADAAAVQKATATKAALEAEVGRLGMQVVTLQRDLDAALTRQEFTQYEQRLKELDEECANKYDETQMLVGEQNLQLEVERAVANEEGVLRNVHEEFVAHKAKLVKDKAALNEFAAQCLGILHQIAEARDVQDTRLARDRSALGEKRQQFEAALLNQRNVRSLLDQIGAAVEKQAGLRRRIREIQAAQMADEDL